jgi:hypothetical protein
VKKEARDARGHEWLASCINKGHVGVFMVSGGKVYSLQAPATPSGFVGLLFALRRCYERITGFKVPAKILEV